MKKIRVLVIIWISAVLTAKSQVKILFDATKAETASNADWVIDADLFNLGFNKGPAVVGQGNEANPQRLPTPAQSTVTSTTTESYWKGGISAWGIDCVKQGYQVETLPYNGTISYGNSSNPQDLSNYHIFIVVEPNIVFSAAEKTAMMKFVQNGGSLFMVSDHTISDRNNDGWDSPAIWNDFFTNNGIKSNPFGISFDLVDISGNSSAVSTRPNDSLLHGIFGNVTQIKWSNGTTITIDTTVNATVKAAVYKSGSNTKGTTNVMVAYARYGKGKVVAFGDSSPFDDGTGDPNDQLYNGYFLDASGNHQKLIMNATIWLASINTLPVSIQSYQLNQQPNFVQCNWQIAEAENVTQYAIQQLNEACNEFEDIATVAANSTKQTYTYNLPSSKLFSNNKQVAYIRLKVGLNNGNSLLSEVKMVEVNSTNKLNQVMLYPNPAHHQLKVKTRETGYYYIISEQGNCMQQAYLPSSTTTNISISNLPAGNYKFVFKPQNGEYITSSFIKQ